MEAIRHIITPTTNSLQITLPDSFIDEQLEVIILPLTNSEKTVIEDDSVKAANFQNYLLSWPEMSDEEFNYLEEKRNHLNEWK